MLRLTIEQVIFVVDDDEAVRDSLTVLLGAHGYTVQGFESADAFLQGLQPGRRGCALVDVHMPGMSGLELQARLRERGLALPVIMITGFAEVPIAVRAMKAGAVDFIEKPFEDDVIMAAVERALAIDRARQQDGNVAADQLARIDRLTAREREVFELLSVGEPNKVVANRLKISPRTVEVHRARIMEKLEARSLSDLVRLAIAAGAMSESRNRGEH